jgi:ferritin-like metal-binding protein YciE
MAMRPMNSMQDLMIDTLQGLYAGEQRALQLMPQMMQQAGSPELKQAIQQHTQETQQQVQRLEQILAKMGEQPGQKQSPAIDGLVQENQLIMQAGGDPKVLEAAMICGAQKIEHLEIAGYGTAVTFAKLLGDEESARLLAQTLDEEERTDKLLTQIAKSQTNPQAAQNA